MQRLEIPREVLDVFCRRHHVRRLSLFGSILTDRFGPASDVDILVEFLSGHVPGYLGLAMMERELSVLLAGRKIDLRTPGELSGYFRDTVIREAEVLYAPR
jgi:predicted nucleotidyltransferase